MEKLNNPILEQYTNCGFRLFLDVDDAIGITIIADYLFLWLKYRNYKILYHTLGIHKNSKRPHIHFNFVCENRPKLMTNPAQTIKNDDKKLPNYFNDEQLLYIKEKGIKSIHEYYMSNRRMSFKENLNQVSYRDWLKYPCKEGLLQPNYCFVGENDLKSISLEAQAEYKISLKQKEKIILEKSKKLEKNEKFRKIAEEVKTDDYETTALAILSVYQGDIDDDTDLLQLVRKIRNYCWKCGLLSNIKILDKYINV